MISNKTEEALAKVLEAGIHVMFATGKTRASAESLIKNLGISSPGVFLQGLTVYNAEGSIIYQRLLPESVTFKAVDFLEKDYTLVAYSGNDIFTQRTNEYSDVLFRYREPAPKNVHDVVPARDFIPSEGISIVEALDHVPIHKMLVIDEVHRIQELRPRLTEHLGNEATIVQALDTMLEILPIGASKGDGVERALSSIGVDWSEVVAVGDAENDREMLMRAGVGVAMGNAKADIKAIANEIVASNDEDGVVEAINRFVLLN